MVGPACVPNCVTCLHLLVCTAGRAGSETGLRRRRLAAFLGSLGWKSSPTRISRLVWPGSQTGCGGVWRLSGRVLSIFREIV